MIYRWKGLLLTPSRAAAEEMFRYSLSIRDAKYVLQNGEPCEKSKRKSETHEMCLHRRNKTIRVVIKKTYSAFEQSDIWLIVHVGVHSRRG